MNSYRCKCEKKLFTRLTFDGGSSGEYVISLCEECNRSVDREFLVSEEVMQ